MDPVVPAGQDCPRESRGDTEPWGCRAIARWAIRPLRHGMVGLRLTGAGLPPPSPQESS